jgi:hypothetical protein
MVDGRLAQLAHGPPRTSDLLRTLAGDPRPNPPIHLLVS